ncbi:hypothetical protein N866_07165 [Actinotalea ferrariae CF5-4]|uniref:Uncharacterized protein n=1 Tax=Actinotalea ferrariae CF5-4 TaxID=948458 RepID=A0A021VU70_9CELL|nr:hypothetical protein [Actinotalea ferrariae]EYR64673.1 hypothetical protein N866_07165 [Actinotalea ferrariae CF5-4]
MSEPTPADERFVTLQELASYLRLTAGADATSQELSDDLDAALEIAENRVGPLASAGRTYRVFPSGAHLVLPATHLTAITAVQDPDGAEVDVATLEVNATSGIVTLPHRPARRDRPYLVSVTTRDHGKAVAKAVKLIAAHLRGMRSTDGGRGASQFMQSPTDTPAPRGFAIPRAAEELLEEFQ